MKCFWLLADGKTVREISFEKYKKLQNKNWKSEKIRYKLAVQHDGSRADFSFWAGKRHLFLPRAQLKQLLGENQQC